MRIDVRAFLDELEKLGAVSDEQARRSLDRLDTLEQQQPTASQVARYAGVGAASGLGARALSDAISEKTLFHGSKGSFRKGLGVAAAGALTSGAVPLIRAHLDRQAEEETLKRYLIEQEQNPAPVAPVPPVGLIA